MSKNNSRRERKNQQDNSVNNSSQSGGISKVYYWIIGILFLILALLIVFIFNRSGNDVNLSDEEDQSALVQDETVDDTATEDAADSETTEETEEAAEEDTTEETEESAEETEEDTEEEADVEEPEEEDPTEGESTIVNEDAPHDPDYAIDFDGGSADRTAIKNQVMQATGLSSDLIEWWVGNDGPGRVRATVSNSAQTEHYEVYLQYGDGSWQVTSYERLSSNPGN